MLVYRGPKCIPEALGPTTGRRKSDRHFLDHDGNSPFIEGLLGGGTNGLSWLGGSRATQKAPLLWPFLYWLDLETALFSKWVSLNFNLNFILRIKASNWLSQENRYRAKCFCWWKWIKVQPLVITELGENDFYRRSEKSKELCTIYQQKYTWAPQ